MFFITPSQKMIKYQLDAAKLQDTYAIDVNYCKIMGSLQGICTFLIIFGDLLFQI